MIGRDRKGGRSILIWLIPAYLVIATAVYVILGHGIVATIYQHNPALHNHPFEDYKVLVDQIFFVLVLLPALIALTFRLSHRQLLIPQIVSMQRASGCADSIDDLSGTHAGLQIALAAGIGLYLELMIIRFHASCFHLFAYFKNISLLSCFLGLGIGYAKGHDRPLALPIVLPLLALQFVAMHILRFYPANLPLQNPITEQFAMGLPQANNLFSLLFVYAFIALTFSFNALCFVPIGQLASRLMRQRPALTSYAWNLAGSLAGIMTFSILAVLWTPPVVWVIIAALWLSLFFRRAVLSFVPSIVAIAVLVIILTVPWRVEEHDVYSPYQILTLVQHKARALALKTSNAYYQRIMDLTDRRTATDAALDTIAAYYELPYSFKAAPASVLIVGSGTGNDVAAALRSGAQHVDAVEIDPAILEFGRTLHPESPYQSDRVQTFVEDARSYIRRTNKKYDIIVYGLLDSHLLLSGQGGIRLDSYVYTIEAFREARARLRDDGFVCLTFYLLSREIGRKLYLMLSQAIGESDPLVYRVGYDGGCSFLCGPGLRLQRPSPTSMFKEVSADFADRSVRADVATDDWPFFYMPTRRYPVSYLVMIIVVLLVSFILIRQHLAGTRAGFSAPCFFLGAGFMLVETKAITELALVFGSTWFVVTVAVGGILAMSFLANLGVMKHRTPSAYWTYGLLAVSLAGGFGLTYLNRAIVNPWLSRVLTTGVLTLPVFFSGYAFSGELKKTGTVSVALSSNLLGAMLGGCLEYNSMYFGYRYLYALALAVYALAFLSSLRSLRQQV